MGTILMCTLAGLAGFTILSLVRPWGRFRRLVADNRSSLKQKSQLVETSSGPIEYATRGHGFPVLVCHGGAGGWDQGLITARLYLSEGLKAIAPSRFGHLRTPLAADSSAPAQADAYARLLDELGIDRVAVVGVSGGGPSALQFALRHPERAAALVMSAAVSDYVPPRSTGVYRSDFGFYLSTTLGRKVALRAIGVTQDIEARLTADQQAALDELFRSMHPISLRTEGLLHDNEEWAERDRWARDYPLEHITAPTLVVHAVDDSVVPFSHARNTTDSIPGARLLSLPSGGHMRFGHIEAIRDEITTFILEHAAPRAPVGEAVLGSKVERL